MFSRRKEDNTGKCEGQFQTLWLLILTSVWSSKEVLLLMSARHRKMLYRRFREMFLFNVDIFVHVKCLLFPPLHFLLLRNCCEKPWIQYTRYRKLPCCSLLDWLKILPSHCSCFSFCACMLIQEQYLIVHFIQYNNIVPSNGKFGKKNKQTTLKNPLLKC